MPIFKPNPARALNRIAGIGLGFACAGELSYNIFGENKRELLKRQEQMLKAQTDKPEKYHDRHEIARLLHGEEKANELKALNTKKNRFKEKKISN